MRDDLKKLVAAERDDLAHEFRMILTLNFSATRTATLQASPRISKEREII